MSCNYPATGRMSPTGAMTYYGHIQKAAGKIPPLPTNYKEFPLPCGRCTGCKLERSRQWAVRLMHEAQQHKKTSFITLTYNDHHLPNSAPWLQSQHERALALAHLGDSGLDSTRARETHAHVDREPTLSKGDLQGFTKRLNQEVRRRSGEGIKYYACGEYGEQTQRPHYHIAVYGEDFADDRRYWKRSKSGNSLWRSSRLARLWPHGDADIGELTFESAAYVARYILKKITGKLAENHYNRVDREGVEYKLTPEFNVMSRRPGIAKQWFLQNKADVYPSDTVIARGNPSKPPRYYDKLLEALAPHEYEIMKFARETAKRNPENEHPARLEARETILEARLKQNPRSLE